MIKPLTEYFKAVGTPQAMPKSVKRKLSLTKKSTPQKSVKVSPDHANIIDLVSDDEEKSSIQDEVCRKELSDISKDLAYLQNKSICEEASNSSASTIIYTPETPRKSQTPKKSQTPQSSYSKSPGSRDKFFSPVKKRSLKLRSPSKVKKNLYSSMNANEEDQLLLDACQGMDDKTVFLINLIYKYLTTNELEPLLLIESQHLLSKCMNTKKPGMRLVCRLYWRKEGWYRIDQVKDISRGKARDNSYGVDDSTLLEMIDNLTQNGIIESTNGHGSKIDIGFEDCLTLLKLDELKSICKELKIKTNNKLDASECLRAFSKQKTNISSYFVGFKSDNASRALKMLREKVGPCFRLTTNMRQTLSELYQLMYLGMSSDVLREKKLELILINDKIKRECYPNVDVHVDNASVVFKTRDDFERYLHTQNIYDEFLNSTDLTDKCRIIEHVYNLYKNIEKSTMLRYRALPLWLQRFTPPYLYIKILEAGLQELKKMKTEEHIDLAIDIATQLISQKTFRQHKKAEWYAEKALILDKFISDGEQAAKVLLEGFNSDLSEEAKDCLRPRAMKMATRQTKAVSTTLQKDLLQHAVKEEIMENNLNAKHIYKHPMDMNKNRGKIKFETRNIDGRMVQDAEEFCIDQYIREGKYTHGGHWEGRMVSTMFFLLFWDIIYARLPVRGLFLTRYQMFPLDLYLESFYVNRKALIEERLKEILESSIEAVLERMSATWESRPEGELSGINRQLGWESVSAVAQCLGSRALGAVCRRLATNYGYTHSGFPDLTLWNVHTGQVKFVEVKTDSDKPSMKQKQWMHYLRENGIDTEFCYVGVNTTKCKARNSMKNI